jgi:CRP-like cAMP-binding protein
LDKATPVIHLIRNWRWFISAPAQAHARLAERAVIKRYAEGQLVFVAGEAATQTYGVLSGALRIFVTSRSGDEIGAEEVLAGGWFPHVVHEEPLVYLPNCICEQDAVVACFSQPTMAAFARRWPAEYYRGLYYELSSRATAIFGRIELLSLHNLNVRLAVYLLRLALMHGSKERGGLKIAF